MVSGNTQPTNTTNSDLCTSDPFEAVLQRYISKYFRELLLRDVTEKKPLKILFLLTNNIHFTFFL